MYERNEQLQKVIQETHATNQTDIIQARSKSRMEETMGPKCDKRGKNSTSAAIHSMDAATLKKHILMLLKKYPIITSITIYKDERMEDEAFLKQCFIETVSKSKWHANVLNSRENTAQKIAEVLSGPVMGLKVDINGPMIEYRPTSRTVIPPYKVEQEEEQTNNKKKKVEPTTPSPEPEKAPSLVVVHYSMP